MRERSSISNFKLILKFLLFALIVAAAFHMAGEKYKQAAEKNTVNAFTKERMDGFYDQPENSLDMVFIGSSHSYCTFDPEIADMALGTNSWQLGTPSQHPDTSYYLLREVLNHQQPKTVVMELYWDVLDDEFELKQAEALFEVLRNDGLREEYIKEVFPEGDKVKYSLPAIRYQQDYFAYAGNEMEKGLEDELGVSKPWTAPANGTEYYRSKGYVYCDIIMDNSEYDKTNQFKYFNGKDWQFNPTQKKYVEKIISLCKENGINLIFVTAPVANVSMDFIENYDRVNEQVSSFASENNIPYIDYNIVNMEERLLENENFRDDAHLNHSGIEIVDRHFIEWIKEFL